MLLLRSLLLTLLLSDHSPGRNTHAHAFHVGVRGRNEPHVGMFTEACFTRTFGACTSARSIFAAGLCFCVTIKVVEPGPASFVCSSFEVKFINHYKIISLLKMQSVVKKTHSVFLFY